MKYGKIVLKNLFTGQQWRKRHREWTYGHGERGGEGEMHAAAAQSLQWLSHFAGLSVGLLSVESL